MAAARTVSEIRLVNSPTGAPVLSIDYPGKDDAFLLLRANLSRDRVLHVFGPADNVRCRRPPWRFCPCPRPSPN
jgi:hypothetical protein